MALNDADKNRTTGNRLDPRNSTNYLPWMVGAVLVAAALFLFMGDTFTDHTTAPTTTTTPQTVPK